MAHRYGIPIKVEVSERGEPVSFIWRGITYQVEAVVGSWHLTDRWWVSRGESDFGGSKPASDRYYFRVQCAGLAFYEMFYDAEVNWWILDRVLD
jgi:hypothetical protein